MLEESAVREIHVSAITDTVAELAVAACCRLPDVMYRAIESSVEREASPSGKDVLRQLLLNAAHLPVFGSMRRLATRMCAWGLRPSLSVWMAYVQA